MGNTADEMGNTADETNENLFWPSSIFRRLISPK